MSSGSPTKDAAHVASWQPDPWGRHQYRWFDGRGWTESVADGGVQTMDPVAPAPFAPPTVQLAPPAAGTPRLPPSSAEARVAGVQRPSPVVRATQRATSKRQPGKFAKVMLAVVLLLIAGVVAIVAFAPDPDGAPTSTGPLVVPQLLPEATHREMPVDSAMFGDAWPLTAESGTLVCEAVPAPREVLSVFFVDPAGTVYAVNGTARGTIATHGWNDVEAIWKVDPTSSLGTNVDVGPLIAAGLEICEPAAITETPVGADMAGAAVAAMWTASTPEEKAKYCNAWSVAPEAARDAFLAGSEEAVDYWPALELILRENC